MTEDRKWHLAWARFDAYRTNLPTHLDTPQVNRYHDIVSMLEDASGEDLSAFRIPDSEMKPEVTGWTRGGIRRPSSLRMSEESYCDPTFFKQQIDGIVYYFESLNSPAGKPKLGF